MTCHNPVRSLRTFRVSPTHTTVTSTTRLCRRRWARAAAWSTSHITLLSLLVITILSSIAHAEPLLDRRKAGEAGSTHSLQFDDAGPILFDGSDAPISTLHHGDGASFLSHESLTPSSDASHNALARSTSDSTFPQPFDTTVGSNFTTQSCSTFFNGMINAADISACKAISLLLQVYLYSSQLFEDRTNPFSLPTDLNLVLPSLQVPRPTHTNTRLLMRRRHEPVRHRARRVCQGPRLEHKLWRRSCSPEPSGLAGP